MQENIELKPYTSLYVGGKARYFVVATSREDIVKAISFAKEKDLPYFILGGGSNIVVSDSGFPGVVIKISISGMSTTKEDDLSVWFDVGAGENWDNFVGFTVNRGLCGLENLSHIPGTVGASVVQNIGAYGAEVSTSVVSIKVLDTESLTEKILTNNDLNFSYRKSSLNDVKQAKGKYVVLSVTFSLQKKAELNLKYDDLKKYFDSHPDITPNLETVRDAVIFVRNKKFPFPHSPVHGTVGSFWNARPVSEETYNNIIDTLKKMGFTEKAEEMIHKKSAFMVAQGFKVVPGLFIEILGLKGKTIGGAKILETHAGVINNATGTATAKDVKNLSDFVVSSLKKEFDIDVRVEPELVGNF